MDEPNSNLDGEGEAALTKAIKAVRARGGIAIVVAHRPSALAAVDHGRRHPERQAWSAFGPKDEILRPQASVEAANAPTNRPEPRVTARVSA